MLSILSISLTRLQTGNNLYKIENKTRPLIYSLYLTKNLTERIYIV